MVSKGRGMKKKLPSWVLISVVWRNNRGNQENDDKTRKYLVKTGKLAEKTNHEHARTSCTYISLL